MPIFGTSSIVLQNAALGVKMRQYQCFTPYLLRLNFPNLEGIEIEVICDDFWGPLKLDVQKMAKIPF